MMKADHGADPTALSLSKVNLQIADVVPLASLHSHEQRKSLADGNNNHAEPQGHGHDAWATQQLPDRMAWMEHFRSNKKGGVVFLDQETLKKQQGVVKEVMMQVGSQLLSGKLAVRISLPIRIFEPRTLLERVADGWNYAPTLLKKAALTRDPLDRMRLVIAFVVGGFHFCVGQLKPFNPIIGETYQASYPDGAQIAMEHVSHHPVKAAFTLHGPRGLYELTGVFEFESSTSRNSIVNHQIGNVTVTFHDGDVISYTLPQIKMSGVLFGERVVELTGTAKFTNSKHHLTADVDFDANNGFLSKSQADDIKGQIISTARGAAKHPVSILSGSWLSHLQFDGKVYWHVESEPAFAHVPVSDPLPSDSRFREDLVALKKGDIALAQVEKLRLEELQRTDRKIREAYIQEGQRS
ncbi:hypothetical protein P43SY_008773 [Pythium insidiosum]|uniref:Oxysterol-binding protein n=1 Tax=Pythium insidiosum TaxID=114742 RepID=A0AAD5M3I5_PYTIN|nr:hypothetical protein P43SY_008773 [Pythium insidiosum]